MTDHAPRRGRLDPHCSGRPRCVTFGGRPSLPCGVAWAMRLHGGEELAGGERVPVVLAHGIFGYGNVGLGPLRHRYFYGVEDTLHAAGHPVLVTSVPPAGTIASRAAALVRQVKPWVEKVGPPLVVGHSMGGLDLRYALAKLGLAGDVRAYLSVATPHRGSPFADWVVRRAGLPGRLAAGSLRRLGLGVDGIENLTTGYMARFNEEVPDVEGLAYHSVAAVPPTRRHVFPGLRFSYDVIHAAEGDNDGMVGRDSACWGRCLDPWPCDHTHARNQRFFGAEDVGPRYLEAVRTVAEGVPASA